MKILEILMTIVIGGIVFIASIILLYFIGRLFCYLNRKVKIATSKTNIEYEKKNKENIEYVFLGVLFLLLIIITSIVFLLIGSIALNLFR